MTMSPEFRDYLLDMLRPLGAVAARAMFGGDDCRNGPAGKFTCAPLPARYYVANTLSS